MSINGLHIAPAQDPSRLVIGSTRWSADQPIPKEEGKQELMHRSREMLPMLPSCTVQRQWRGIRCVYWGDRSLLTGPVPGRQGLWSLGALGTKGLLWGPLGAKIVVESILHGKEAPESLSTLRTEAKLWQSDHIH